LAHDLVEDNTGIAGSDHRQRVGPLGRRTSAVAAGDGTYEVEEHDGHQKHPKQRLALPEHVSDVGDRDERASAEHHAAPEKRERMRRDANHTASAAGRLMATIALR